jgi:hypothetical protein
MHSYGTKIIMKRLKQLTSNNSLKWDALLDVYYVKWIVHLKTCYNIFLGLCLTPTSYSLKLVSYQSKVLEEYHLDISDSTTISVPPKLKNFCQNSLSLCPGINGGKVSGNEKCLIETLNEEIICRSRKCLYATTSPSSPCNECLKLKLLSELNQDSGKAICIIRYLLNC